MNPPRPNRSNTPLHIRRHSRAATLIGAILMSPLFAFADSPDCTDPGISRSRECTDPRAAEIAQTTSAWLGCGGACVIRQNGADAELLNRQGQRQKTLPNQHFLPGNGRTDCLSSLAFVQPGGLLTVLDAHTLTPRATYPLANLYAVDFTTEPHLLETVRLGGRLSCDGKRFFAPSLDGTGFAVLKRNAKTFIPAIWQNAPQAVIISPSGRFGLGVDNAENYRLLDFASGRHTATNGIFEQDLPFFDVDETHLLMRTGETPKYQITIYRLSDGRKIGQAPYPAEGGLRFRVSGNQLIPLK